MQLTIELPDQERDEQARPEFIETRETLTESKLVYVDETGMNDNLYRSAGWALSGTLIYLSRGGKKSYCIDYSFC